MKFCENSKKNNFVGREGWGVRVDVYEEFKFDLVKFKKIIGGGGGGSG